MKRSKRSLHQFEGRIIKDGLIREDYPDRGRHIDRRPYQKFPACSRGFGHRSHIVVDLVTDAAWPFGI
jgi:hypothetical protein